MICRIPLAPRSKVPLLERWSKLAADDPLFAQVADDHPDANVGIRLDGLVVVDCDSPERVAWWRDQGFETEFVSRGRPERRSFWYRLPEGADGHTIRLDDIEVRTGPGAQCVVPPSVHPDGGRYEWLGLCVCEAHWWEIPELHPDDVEAVLPRQAAHMGFSGGGWDAVSIGGRDNFLASVGGFLRAQGMSEEGIYRVLGAVNHVACVPPLPGSALVRIAHSVARYTTEHTYHLVIDD